MKIKYSDSRSGIYRITCLVNNLVYIGQTINFGQRLTGHRKMLRNGKHYNKRLQASFDKHGEKSFVAKPIAIIEDIRDRTLAEQNIVNLYKRRKYKMANKNAPVSTPMLGTKRPDAAKFFAKPEIRKLAKAAWLNWAMSDDGQKKLKDIGVRSMAQLS